VKSRLAALAVIFVLAFAVLLGRLVKLQVADAEVYERRAEDVRRRVQFVGAPRGTIVDRKGRVLAVDVPTYRLSAVLSDMDPGRSLPGRIARILRKPRAELELRWDAAAAIAATRTARDEPIALAEAPSPASVKAFTQLAKSTLFEGLSVEGTTLRASPALLRRRADVIERLRRLSGLDAVEAERRLDAAARRADAAKDVVERAARLAAPIVLTQAVPFEVVAEIEEDAHRFPGVLIEVVPERRNPYGEVMGHVLGSVGPPVPLAVEGFGVLGSVDLRAGLDGVEASRNLVLAGTPGARVTEWDRKTRETSVLAEEPPVPGATLRLTIDAELQRATEAALDEAVRRYAGKGKGGGAAVLLDARTGEVLALASAPRYDPSRLRRDFAQLAATTPSALLQRAVSAELPPGSIMKILTSAAALEAGAITPESAVFCNGYLHTRKAFKCNGYHAEIGLKAALARSCNVFFYKAGEALGEGPMTAWARAFGLGRATGIDLPGERRGLVPSTAWKRERYESQRRRVEAGVKARDRAAHEALLAALTPGLPGLLAAEAAARELSRREARLAQAREYLVRTRNDRAWTPGDDRNTAIGQGNLLVTPLQMARLAAAIASNGKLFRPKLFLGAEATAQAAPGASAPTATAQALASESPAGDAAEPDPDATPDPLRTLVEVCDTAEMAVRPSTWEAVRAGMLACVNANGGTAHKSGLMEFKAAAKTGTAEAPGGSHAWIAGYAPAAAPEVAFAIVIEFVADGLHGGDVAGPAAARVLAAYEEAKRAPAAPASLDGEGRP